MVAEPAVLKLIIAFWPAGVLVTGLVGFVVWAFMVAPVAVQLYLTPGLLELALKFWFKVNWHTVPESPAMVGATGKALIATTTFSPVLVQLLAEVTTR
jgi:hypothetical protein